MSGQKANTALMVAHGTGAPIAFNSSGGAEEWVMLMPIGSGGMVSTVDGRGPYRVTNPAKLATASLTAGRMNFVQMSRSVRLRLSISSERNHIYSTLDSFILAAFGTAWAIHKKAALAISDPNFKWIDKSKWGGGVESAWIKIARQQATLMASLGDRLGLDPKSRAALKMPDAKQRKSKFAGLLGLDSASSNLKN